MKKFYSKVSGAALLLCLAAETVFSMEEKETKPLFQAVFVPRASDSQLASLKFSDMNAVQSWSAKMDDFIKRSERAALISKLEEMPVSIILTLDVVRVQLIEEKVFESWNIRAENILDPKHLPAFPMNKKKLIEGCSVESPGNGAFAFKIGNVYNFLALYCEIRRNLCVKIAKIFEEDAEKIKYLKEAQRSLSYYFCHNFTPQISSDKMLQKKLRDLFFEISDKFFEDSRQLEVLSFDTHDKAKYVKKQILNLTQQVDLLEETTHLNETSSEKREKSNYKTKLMGGLALSYLNLDSHTGTQIYSGVVRKIKDDLPKDSTQFRLLQDMMTRASQKAHEKKSLLDTFGNHFEEDEKLLLRVQSKMSDIRGFLKKENFSSAVAGIKSLEKMIYTNVEDQSARPQSQDATMDSPLSSLKKVYRNYYVLMERSEFLYPTIIDFIKSFMIVGDIQGALDRFNASEDLKFNDRKTLRTHHPYLKAILENLRGNPEELLEISQRNVEELSLQNKSSGAGEALQESVRDVTSKKRRMTRPSGFPFLIHHENDLPYSIPQVKGDEGRLERSREEWLTHWESKRISRVPLGLRQIVTFLVKKFEEKSNGASLKEPESKKPRVSLTGAAQSPILAPLPKISAQPQESAEEERREKFLRHLARNEERERKLRAAAAGPADVDADVPGAVKSQKSEPEKPFENDTRTISDLYKLKKTALKVETEIANGSWRFKRDEFVAYLQKLGCTQRNNHGSHQIVELPDMVFYERDGRLITILSKDLNIQGGSLTLQKSWDDKYNSVPFILRPQILAAREKLRQLAIAIEQKKVLDCEEDE